MSAVSIRFTSVVRWANSCGHGLLERDGRRYCCRLTEKGKRVAAMFVLFPTRICGPPANSLFHHRPQPSSPPPVPIEAACHKADDAMQKLALLCSRLRNCSADR